MSATNRSKDLFLDALDIPAGERAAFLDKACAGDGELRDRVERLITAHGHAEEVLATDLALPASIPGASGTALDLSPGDRVANVGCNNGELPTVRRSLVTSLDRYLGPPNL